MSQAAVGSNWKPYPAYKDSGVEWLGKIPAHWEVKRLKYVAPPREEKLVEKPDDLPYLGMEHIESKTGRLILDTPVENVESTVYVFDPGDVVFGKLRPYLAKVAHVDFRGVCTSELLPLHPAGSVQGRFLLYQLLCDDFIKLVNSFTYGTKMPRASPEQIGNVPVPFLPDSEQQIIAAFLDWETAKIDALVAKKERLIELLQEKRATLITQAVTKGLDPTVPMKDSGVEWLGQIPAHWNLKRVRHVVRRIEQGWSPDCENREAEEDEWGVLKAGCVNRGVFIESEHKALPVRLQTIPELEIRPGDLLMSRASGSRELVGSVAVVPSCRPRLLLCDKVFRLHVDAETASRRFLAFAMNSCLARWQIEVVLSGGSGLANNIAQEVVKDLILVMPAKDEQRAIAAFLDRETAKIDALITKVREGIERLKEYRTALISAAVTGKIDVRDNSAKRDQLDAFSISE